MELEDEIILEDDLDIIDIIIFGFPRRRNEREHHFETVLERIENVLEFPNDMNNSLSPANQLLLALRFFASNGHQIAIGDFMGAHQTTASRIIKKVSNAIADLCPHYIKMGTAEERVHIQSGFHEIARFPRVVGCIDGTHIKIQSPGDSGYTLKPYLLTPLINPLNRAEQLYNKAQIRTRNTVERCIGVWKRRFPVLAYGLTCKLETTLSVIVATSVLHNIAVDMNLEFPPPAENINIEELEYQIAQGNIPDALPQDANIPNNNYRQILINNYFADL